MNNKDSGISIDFTFSTTPIWKILVLTFLTFGLYELIWIYNIWKVLEPNLPNKISPFWRTFFGNITNFFLFPILAKYLTNHNKNTFPPIIFATLYILINMTHKLVSPYWLISFCTVFIIIYIQSRINSINLEYYPNAKQNNWNKFNTYWAIFCLIILTITIM